MHDIKKRIKKGVESIVRAKEKGLDTTKWENHLFKLIDELGSGNVKVKAGRFNFCTCSTDIGLCAGCWRVQDKCECTEMIVNPETEINRVSNAIMEKSQGCHQ